MLCLRTQRAPFAKLPWHRERCLIRSPCHCRGPRWAAPGRVSRRGTGPSSAAADSDRPSFWSHPTREWTRAWFDFRTGSQRGSQQHMNDDDTMITDGRTSYWLWATKMTILQRCSALIYSKFVCFATGISTTALNVHIMAQRTATRFFCVLNVFVYRLCYDD